MPTISKLIARHLAFPVLVKSGASRILAYQSKHPCLILNYHGVVDQPQPEISVNHMGAKDFDDQIRYFKRNFNLLGLDDFVETIHSDKPSSKKSILITFDDGYANNYDYAFPILQNHKAPAVIFPVTGLIGTEKASWYDYFDLTKHLLTDSGIASKIKFIANDFGLTFDTKENLHILTEQFKSFDLEKKSAFLKQYMSVVGDDVFHDSRKTKFWKMLNDKQIKEMSESGLITFGSHTVSHPNLDLINPEIACNELAESKAFLEKITGKTVKSIAFPDGGYNDGIKNMVREIGYEIMFSVTPKCKSDQHENDIFRRFSVPNTTTTSSVIFNACNAFRNQGVGR